MNHLIVAVSLLVLSTAVTAQQPKRVAPSGRGTTEVVITFVDSAARANAKAETITIDYGTPSLRGRMMHTDSLVPYDKVWRLGANEATTLSTDVDLEIGGSTLPKGKYILQALPARAGWKLIVYRDGTPSSGDGGFDAKGEVARIDLRTSTRPSPVETFTMWLVPSRDPGSPRGQLVISWGTVSLSTDWSMK